MPEGPEIKQAADKIASAIIDFPVKEIFFAFERLKPYESELKNHRITKVDTKGKAMLIHFDNELTIYSHNQLYGKWMVRKAYDYPKTNRQLRLAIHNHQKSALLYSASDIEVLDKDELALHLFLNRLGPDILDETLNQEQIINRLQDKKFIKKRFSTLFLDQGFLAGNGNYLRSEILFVGKIHPTLRPIDCNQKQLQKLAQAALTVPRQSYETKGITNNLEIVAELKAKRYKRQEYRHWVFGREDKPCYICSTNIIKDTTGGRRYYYCPQCQKQ
ncbi:MAG: endonuclease VIII [Cyanobacteriota bacterium]|nr:endonuclease VIII [Cyanobacteriota bacterium]